MASTRNATYKIYNGTDWDTYYFKTSAGQVGETNGTLNFLRPNTHKVNGKSFWSGTAHQGITLYGTDIKMSSSESTTLEAAIKAIQDDYVTSDELTNYEYAVVTTTKAGLAPVIPTTNFNQADSNTIVLAYRMGNSNTPEWVPLPTNAFKNDNTWRNIYINNTQMSSTTEYKGINFVGGTGITLTPSYNSGDPYRKITISMDDSALGNVKYAGLFNPNTKEATLSDDAGATTSLTMTLPTSAEITEGGLDDNTYYIPAIGNYFIATADGDFDGISFVTGDWIIYNGTANGWGKVDNTDAVTSVAGMTGNITTSNLASALVPTLSDTFATTGHNHDSVYLKLTGGTVTGATTFSNLQLSANTFKTQGGTYTMTLPAKSGTVALTSDLSSYATTTALNNLGTTVTNIGTSVTNLTDAVSALQSDSHKIFTGSTTPTGMKTGDIWLQY